MPSRQLLLWHALDALDEFQGTRHKGQRQDALENAADAIAKLRAILEEEAADDELAKMSGVTPDPLLDMLKDAQGDPRRLH